jgi:hypothetical protein
MILPTMRLRLPQEKFSSTLGPWYQPAGRLDPIKGGDKNV